VLGRVSSLLRASALMACLVAGAAISQQAAAPLGSMSFLKPGAVVLFQGDSVTDGGRQRTGSDFNHIMGQDYAYMVAGELGVAFPERGITFVNRGISGDRVVDLKARWAEDTIALKPNVLSILVGINDTLAVGEKAESVEMFEETYDKLLGDTLAALPGVRIVLGEPFLLPVGKHKATYAAELVEVRKRQAVVEKLAAKYHVPVVRYQEMMDAAVKRAPAEHWCWDGVHPTYAGHWLMAQEWLRTVQERGAQ
jgi:lysophospholipase L1-like esterase